MADMTQDQLDARRRAEMTHAAPANGASAAVSRIADALERVGTVPEDVRFSNPLSLMSYIPGLGRPGSILPGAAYGIPAAVVNAPGNLKKMFMGAMEETGQRVTGQVPPGTPLSADMLGLLMSMPTAGMLMTPKGAVGMSGGRLASAAERLPMDEASRMARVGDGWPRAGAEVDGRIVRKDVPNLGSISASFEKYEELPGVREVPMAAMDAEYRAGVEARPLDARTQRLADEIAQNREINPLIVAIDDEGPYILEGGHRFDALVKSGAKSFPAVVVHDNTNLLAAGGVGPVGPMMLAAPPKSEPLAHPGRGSAMGWY